MTRKAANRYKYILLVISVFVAVSLFMTYNIINMPSLVIGDNFYWTPKTAVDVLGPRIIRESYLGDVGVLSTFKNGFLYPLVYSFSSLGIPTAIIYPFFFYVLSMFSFYSLSTEFLKTRPFLILVSVLYVVNPVTPYYYASIQNVFVIIFLPLMMKFFARNIRDLEKIRKTTIIFPELHIMRVFPGSLVSAHEQFLLSAALVGAFFIVTQTIVVLKKFRFTFYSIRLSSANLFTYLLIFTIVNLPLVISIANVQNAPLSVYFSGRLSNFISNVQHNYSTLTPATMLRFGGDSGVGLGTTSWYDLNILTNLLGYSIFAVFLISVAIHFLKRKRNNENTKFFSMNILLFVSASILLVFVKLLPDNKILLDLSFNFVLQTWQNPIKIRVIMLLSALAVTMIALRTMETFGATKRKRLLKWAMVCLLIFTVIGYNSPWLINYAGYTPIQEVSDNLKWGQMFDQQYANIANNIEQNISQERGLVVPYTTKTELYIPPNFRLFQVISGVNKEIAKLTQGEQIAWSKTLGLLSVNSVVLNEQYNPTETLTFPISLHKNNSEILKEIKNDPGFSSQESMGSATILRNNNALPMLYATNYYVFYDETSTLNYALRVSNLTDLPVFLKAEAQTNQITIPNFANEDTYTLYAVSPKSNSTSQTAQLITDSNDNHTTLNLEKTASYEDVEIYSTSQKLRSRDTISIPDSDWIDKLRIKELTLNSNSYSLGIYDSFKINSTINILKKGEFSFLGPRIIIDNGNEKYYLIFHDYGALELAMLKDGEFTSGLTYVFTGFNMENMNKSIDVGISRMFDEVQVYINGYQEMSFYIGTKTANVYLSSESSTSKFTDVSTQNSNILRLFAVRNVETKPEYTIEQTNVDFSRLVVTNAPTDYAVVCQYLYTPLRVVRTGQTNYPVAVNIFFSGWIMQPGDLNTQKTLVEIGVENAPLIMGLTAFSIISTYVLCIAALQPSPSRKVYSYLINSFKKLIQFLRPGEKKAIGTSTRRHV